AVDSASHMRRASVQFGSVSGIGRVTTLGGPQSIVSMIGGT
ncbi:MAG: hypothetical protein QOH89_2872, partial [Pseudonocardiales bacterium]|nr:hypothetical protein [Pseudonocardiales bacterium]